MNVSLPGGWAASSKSRESRIATQHEMPPRSPSQAEFGVSVWRTKCKPILACPASHHQHVFRCFKADMCHSCGNSDQLYTFVDLPFDFRKFIETETAKIDANTPFISEGHPWTKKFEEAVWVSKDGSLTHCPPFVLNSFFGKWEWWLQSLSSLNDNHELIIQSAESSSISYLKPFVMPVQKKKHPNEPMPGEEDDDIMMDAAGLPNSHCPLTMIAITKLKDPVRGYICRAFICLNLWHWNTTCRLLARMSAITCRDVAFKKAIQMCMNTDCNSYVLQFWQAWLALSFRATCRHIYEKEPILGYIGDKKMPCPMAGDPILTFFDVKALLMGWNVNMSCPCIFFA